MSKLPEQLSLNIKLDDSVSLEKFIHCESNNNSLEFLKSSILEGSTSNLFYIYGREGVGKSYIMRALNREFSSLNKKTLHLSLMDSRITSHEIFQNLGSLDVLLIEKIEKLPKDKDWEVQFFSLINDALSSKTKIYISSNKVSKDLEITLMDLRSRLSYFTAIEIPEITQAEKIEALSQSSRRKGFDLDRNSLQYIINHTSRSLSDLLGLIDDLDGYALKKKKKVTAALVRELLASRPHNSRK